MSEALWLSAESCAEKLDLRTRDGKVSRRAFLERYACRPSFPAPAGNGRDRRWEWIAVDRWMKDEAKIQARRKHAA